MKDIIGEFTKGVDVEAMAQEIHRLRQENEALKGQLNGRYKKPRTRREVTPEHQRLWLQLDSEGFTPKQIAERTGHGMSTVANHLNQLKKTPA